MLKSDLITQLADRFPALPLLDIRLIADTILERMTGALASGDRIEIRGFGSFSLRYRPPRISRNPQTGDKVEVGGQVRAGVQGREGAAGASG